MSSVYSETDTIHHETNIVTLVIIPSETNTIVHDTTIRIPLVYDGDSGAPWNTLRILSVGVLAFSETDTIRHMVEATVFNQPSETNTIVHNIRLGPRITYRSGDSFTPWNTLILRVSGVRYKYALIRVYRAYSFSNLSKTRLVTSDYGKVWVPDIITPGSLYMTLLYEILANTYLDLVLADGSTVYRGVTDKKLYVLSNPPHKIQYSGIIGYKSRVTETPVELLKMAPSTGAGNPVPLISSTARSHPIIVVENLDHYKMRMVGGKGLYLNIPLILVNTSSMSLPGLPIGLHVYFKPGLQCAKVTITPSSELEPGAQQITLRIPLDKYTSKYGTPIYDTIVFVDKESRQIMPTNVDLVGETLVVWSSFHHPGGTEQVECWICFSNKNYVAGISETQPDGETETIAEGDYYELHYVVEGWYLLGDNELYAIPVDYEVPVIAEIPGYTMYAYNIKARITEFYPTAPFKLEFFSVEPIGEEIVDPGTGVSLSEREASIEGEKLKLVLDIANNNRIDYVGIPLVLEVEDTSVKEVVASKYDKLHYIPANNTTTMKLSIPVPKNYRVTIRTPLFIYVKEGAR